MRSLFLIKPIRREMEATLKLDPAHGGAHHVLGEILWQVPGLAGGDKKRALKEFEAARLASPDYTATHVPLAEAYLAQGMRGEAKAVLEEGAAIKAPADPGEYQKNLEEARLLLSRLKD